MEQEKLSWSPLGWVGEATSGIRFKPDREAVQEELYAHIEDKIADLTRLYPEMGEWEVKKLATQQMGDPREVGRTLAVLYRPWLGWLWRASQVLLAVALGLSLLFWVPRAVEWARTPVDGLGSQPDVFSCYLAGDDPTQAGGPLAPDTGEEPFADLEAVLVARPGVSTRAGDYLLRVDRLALRHGRLRETGREFANLYFTLAAWGPPWQKMLQEAALRISGTDDLGNYYYSTYETHELRVELEEDSLSLLTNVTDEGWFSRTFSIQVSDVPREAEWLRLEYDWGGTRWELTIPLTEEGER